MEPQFDFVLAVLVRLKYGSKHIIIFFKKGYGPLADFPKMSKN
jgi:hypothetical protein